MDPQIFSLLAIIFLQSYSASDKVLANIKAFSKAFFLSLLAPWQVNKFYQQHLSSVFRCCQFPVSAVTKILSDFTSQEALEGPPAPLWGICPFTHICESEIPVVLGRRGRLRALWGALLHLPSPSPVFHPGLILDWECLFCPPPKPFHGSFACRIGLLTSYFHSVHMLCHSYQMAAEVCSCLSPPQ